MNPQNNSESSAGRRRYSHRAFYPLMNAPTPHFLQRFSYNHNGEAHVFDEFSFGPMLGSNHPTSVKRNQPQMADIGGPAPKRREFEADSDGWIVVAEDAQASRMPASQAQPLWGVLSQEQEQRQEPPEPQPLSSHPAHIPATAPPPQQQQRRQSNNVQPSLLSPTASPRSPQSPQSPDIADSDIPASNVEISPSLSTPNTAGPPSARAYAPLPTSTIAPGSPLPMPMVPPSQHVNNNTNAQPSHQRDTIKEEIALISETFDKLPPALHGYTLFNLFRSCSRNTLSALFGELESALRFDILGNLPPELSSMVLRHLDVASIVAAAEVSRTWYKLVDSDEALWQNLLELETLHPSPKDVETARFERWGYTGWPTLYNRPDTEPVNAFGKPVNVYKAVYRRLILIHQNWMSPDITPKRYEIQCPDREVITCLDFSEDIIIASTEGKKHLNVYDTQSGMLLHEFTSHEGGVWALKRVGKDIIVSGSTDHTVRVWSLSKNRCTHVFRGHHATVRCLDVVMPDPSSTARDYPVILTGSRDTTMRIWRLPDPDDADYDSKVAFVDKDNPYFVAELRGHEDSVRAVCGHKDVAVSGSYDSRVRVWDLATHRCKHILEGHTQKVYAAIIDPERNRCISASLDYNIKIWDLDTGAQLYTLEGHKGLVGLLGLYDNTLVSAAADKTLRIWNPENGSLSHCLTGHNSAILCFDHDGRRIVSGSERHLKLWDSRTGKFARDLLTDIERIWQVSFDRRRCVAAVARGRSSYLEILDFDFEPPPRGQRQQQAQVPDNNIIIPPNGSGTVEEISATGHL